MNGFQQDWRGAVQTAGKFAMPVVLSALLICALAVSAFEHTGTGHSLSYSGLLSALRDPLAYLAQRSPGERGAGELLQSKHRMFKLSRQGVKAYEQVLANVRYSSPPPDNVDDLAAQVPSGVFEPGFNPSFDRPGTLGILGLPSPVVPIGLPDAGGGGSGGAGGGNGSSKGNTGSNASVPEPSTWLTLTWGIGLIGFAMRRRTRDVTLTNRREKLVR